MIQLQANLGTIYILYLYKYMVTHSKGINFCVLKIKQLSLKKTMARKQGGDRFGLDIKTCQLWLFCQDKDDYTQQGGFNITI